MHLWATSSLLSLLVVVNAGAAERRGAVTAKLLASADVTAPGQTFMLGVHLKIPAEWHTYWINPGETGEATRIKLSGPPGFEFGAIQWPLPRRIDAPGGVSYGYEDEVMLMVPVRVAQDIAAGGAITAEVSWLVCKEECIKGGAKLALDVPVGSKSKPANQGIFEQWRGLLPLGQDKAAADGPVSHVEQVKGPDGSAKNEILVKWKDAPAKIEWFPVASTAVAIEDVKLAQDGQTTRITFKPTVFKPGAVKEPLDSVLVYQDKSGRRGLSVPFKLAK